MSLSAYRRQMVPYFDYSPLLPWRDPGSRAPRRRTYLFIRVCSNSSVNTSFLPLPNRMRVPHARLALDTRPQAQQYGASASNGSICESPLLGSFAFFTRAQSRLTRGTSRRAESYHPSESPATCQRSQSPCHRRITCEDRIPCSSFHRSYPLPCQSLRLRGHGRQPAQFATAIYETKTLRHRRVAPRRKLGEG